MTNAQPEPSMEEILASIRRIISEDEEEGAAPAAQPVSAEPKEEIVEPAGPTLVETAEEEIEPEGADEPLSEIDDEVGEVVGDDVAETHLETEDVQMIKNNVAEALEHDDAMLGDQQAAAAQSAFQNLSQSIRVSAGEGRTLEDLVTDLLRPMVKEWLDANLPTIVEEKVEDEVQRLARRRG